MRALGLLLLLVLPCAVPATPPTDDTAPTAPRLSIRTALDPNPAPCDVPTTFELPSDPAY